MTNSQNYQILETALKKIASHISPKDEHQGSSYFVECQWVAVQALAKVQELQIKSNRLAVKKNPR